MVQKKSASERRPFGRWCECVFKVSRIKSHLIIVGKKLTSIKIYKYTQQALLWWFLRFRQLEMVSKPRLSLHNHPELKAIVNQECSTHSHSKLRHEYFCFSYSRVKSSDLFSFSFFDFHRQWKTNLCRADGERCARVFLDDDDEDRSALFVSSVTIFGVLVPPVSRRGSCLQQIL